MCGITALGYDHCNVLGHTLEEIAAEKAGILKRNVPAFSYAQQSVGVERVLATSATRVGAPLAFVKPIAPSTSAPPAAHLLLGSSKYCLSVSDSLFFPQQLYIFQFRVHGFQ